MVGDSESLIVLAVLTILLQKLTAWSRFRAVSFDAMMEDLRFGDK